MALCGRPVVRRKIHEGRWTSKRQTCNEPARFVLVDWSGKVLDRFCGKHIPPGVPAELVRPADEAAPV